MLEQYLGPEVFRQGIHEYLERHRYGNAETSDLWDALESASGQPVRAVMDSWVFRAGYPLIRAELSPDGQAVTLSQRQFRYQEGGDGQWRVPVVVGTHRSDGSQASQTVLLEETPLTIAVPDDIAWLTVNQGGWGFYRVAYDPQLWERITQALDEMTAVERFSLVDDVWNAVLAHEVPLIHAVRLWRMLGGEQDPDVWGSVFRSMALLDKMADDDERTLLQRLIREVAQPVFDKLTWESSPGEDVRRGRLRGLMIRLLGTLGADPAVRKEARDRLLAHIHGATPMPPELLTPATEVVAVSGGPADWDLIYRQFKKATTPQDETRYLFALAQFTAPALVERTLQLYRSSEVRIQDGVLAIGQILANRQASRATWDMIEKHWDEILAKYPKVMVQYITSPISSIVEEELAGRTVAWLDTHPVEEVARQIDQAKEFQRVNRAFARRVTGQMATLLEASGPA
jgi:puromycin-sensitive aminopeptidase